MPADPDDARRIAEDILSGPEYQEPATPWWQKALDWVDEVFRRLFGSLGGSGGAPAIGWAIVIVVVALALVVVFFALRSIRRSRRRREEGPAEPTTRRVRREEPVDWDERAEALEAQGRWRDGLRARYRALVGELSRDDVIDPAASRTTGEHRAEVGAAKPAAGPDFGEAAELFDRAWYGNRPTGPEEAERFARLARRVEESAR